MHRGLDEHQMKRRSFAFYLAYIKCFRTYSVYLSLRLPAQILYAGIHLCPLAVLRSCFGYSLSHLRTAAACLSRCIRHRRRSKAKPLRGRRGRSRAAHRINAVCNSTFRIILRHCPFKMCAHGAHTLTFAPKGQNISHAQSAYFTAAKRRFHTAACRRISLQSGLCPLCLCRYRLFRRGKI